jgi:hypothetical protein
MTNRETRNERDRNEGGRELAGARDRADGNKTIMAILFFGGVWGIMEATLGFLLHFLPRVMPFPRVAGFVMFPIGLIFLIGAAHATKRPSSALGVAAVAAVVKVASLALPVVRWNFVRNPALAIISEGLIVFLGLYVTGFAKVSLRSVTTALGVSLGWRGIFLLLNVILGIRGGIMARPTGALLQFVFFEGAVNAALIVVFMAAGTIPWLISDKVRNAVVRPVPVAAALVVAVIAEFGTALI